MLLTVLRTQVSAEACQVVPPSVQIELPQYLYIHSTEQCFGHKSYIANA